MTLITCGARRWAFAVNKLTGMRQFYTLPVLKKVLRLNKNKERIKIVFWIFVTFVWHTLLKFSHNTIKVFARYILCKKVAHVVASTLSLYTRGIIKFPKDFDCSSIDLI